MCDSGESHHFSEASVISVAKILRSLVFASIAILATGFVVADEPVAIDAQWGKQFEPRDGWAGGDAVYSTRLSDGRVLWLFADSFAGKLTIDGEKQSRPGTKFLNNTAAISDKREDGKPNLRFFVAKKEDGSPDTWIKPDDGRGWYWPAAPVATEKGVAILLWRVEKAAGDGAFGFRVYGSDLAIVDDTSGDLADWKFRKIPLPFCGHQDKQTITFGAAATVLNDDAYIFGWRNRQGGFPDNQGLVAKVPLSEIGNPGQWRFFAGRDEAGQAKWADTVEKADVVCRDVAAELSVSYDAPRNRWIMIHHEGFLGPSIVVRTAPEVTGPWSAPQKIYRCPEVDLHKSVFCYASKGHPELSGADDLLITYASNSNDFGTLINDARIYIPKAVRLDLRQVK